MKIVSRYYNIYRYISAELRVSKVDRCEILALMSFFLEIQFSRKNIRLL